MVYLPRYIWLIFMVNVGKYTIHGWYGVEMLPLDDLVICHYKRYLEKNAPRNSAWIVIT